MNNSRGKIRRPNDEKRLRNEETMPGSFKSKNSRLRGWFRDESRVPNNSISRALLLDLKLYNLFELFHRTLSSI